MSETPTQPLFPFLLRAPRGAMEFVRAKSMEDAALIGAKTWKTTPFTVYDLSQCPQRTFEAETETLVTGVRSA